MPAHSAVARVLPPREYARLRDDLEQILATAEDEARRVASRLAARAYWRVGKRLEKARLTDRAGYRNQVLRDLAGDLGLAVRLLQDAQAFARAYPTRPADSGLGWSHYRELLHVTDGDARTFYAELASEEKMSVRALRDAIQQDLFKTRALPAPKGSRKKGGPKLARPAEPTYIYRAHVDRVVDADTLDLTVDLGFDVLKRHRIRLAGIDAPASNTKAGAEATRFVTETLAAAQTVVVQTRKFDLHGRYVAHLFYSTKPTTLAATFTNGTYLNQELLDEHHAKPFQRASAKLAD